jgi:hypothetical protein
MIPYKPIRHKASLKWIDDTVRSFDNPTISDSSKDFAVRIDERDWTPVR